MLPALAGLLFFSGISALVYQVQQFGVQGVEARAQGFQRRRLGVSLRHSHSLSLRSQLRVPVSLIEPPPPETSSSGLSGRPMITALRVYPMRRYGATSGTGRVHGFPARRRYAPWPGMTSKMGESSRIQLDRPKL